MRPYEIEQTRNDCFCEEIITKGTPLFYNHNNKTDVNILTANPQHRFMGISLYDVVDVDTMKYMFLPTNTITSGSKICVLTRGKLIMRLPKSWGRLPIGQPLYWDGKKYTWKKVSVRVAKVYSMNEDGYCVVEIG